MGQPAPSQYSVAGAAGSTAAGGGTMFNNLNTNTSGRGVVASRQQEETGVAGVGMQLGQAQGATGGVGVIMGGVGPVGIQAGIPAGASGEDPVPKKKVLCKTAGCSFYAKPELENLCTDCYREYYEENEK